MSVCRSIRPSVCLSVTCMIYQNTGFVYKIIARGRDNTTRDTKAVVGLQTDSIDAIAMLNVQLKVPNDS